MLAAMDKVAAEHGTSLSVVALAWLLHQRAVTSVILGVMRLDQLEENLKAVELRLSDEDIAVLDAASTPPVEYPGWMFAFADAARTTLLRTGRLPPSDMAAR